VQGEELLAGGEVAGRVLYTLYSPALETQIGYGLFRQAFGFAGIDGLSTAERPDLQISTVSTPFFLPTSSRVQMQ